MSFGKVEFGHRVSNSIRQIALPKKASFFTSIKTVTAKPVYD